MMQRSLCSRLLPAFLVLLLFGTSLSYVVEDNPTLSYEKTINNTSLNVETSVSITNYPNGTSNDLKLEVPQGHAVTDMDLSLRPHIHPISQSMAWSTSSDWNMTGVITDGVDFNSSSGMTVLPQGYSWDFESGSIPSPWTMSGTSNWVAQTGTTLSGQYSAQSGSIYHNQWTAMSVTISNMVGTGSFKFRTSTETNYDYLLFCIDNTGCSRYSGYYSRWSGYNSGTQSFNIASGTHTYTWKYYKDGSVNSGSDRVWIDDVVFTPSGGGGTGEANWTSPQFGPGATGNLKTTPDNYGIMSVDATTSGSSTITWDILDGVSKQPIYGFSERTELFSDLGSIDWEKHPTIRLRLHLYQASGTITIHGVGIEGRYEQSFTRNPDWSGSINWDGDSYPGAGTITSPIIESSSPISRLKSTATYSGSGQLYVSADGGAFTSISNNGQVHTFSTYVHSLQFQWQSSSSGTDFRSVRIDIDSGGLPLDPAIDVGLDGLKEWELSHPNIGPWGWQNRLSTGGLSHDFSFTTSSSKQVGVWLPKSGVDCMRFSINPSSATIQNLVVELSLGGVTVYSESMGTFSDSQIITLNSTSLASLNTQLNNVMKIWPAANVQTGMNYSQAVFTLTADYGTVRMGGISGVSHPYANLSYDTFDQMVWSVNDLLSLVNPNSGTMHAPLSIQMSHSGVIKATIKNMQLSNDVSTDSLVINNGTTTLAPSYQWLEVNSTHTAPVGTVSAVQLDLMGSLHHVQMLCREDGTIAPVQGSSDENMILWDANGCSLDVNATSSFSTLRFRLNASWDDEEHLMMRIRIVLNDGRRSVPISQSFGPNELLAIENDVEVVSWGMFNDLGLPIPVDKQYLKHNSPISISVDLGFNGLNSNLAPKSGDVAVRIFENDVIVANSTNLVNGSVVFNLVSPLSSQPIEYRVDIYPLYGQENFSSIVLNRTYEIDSLSPMVINQNIRKFDHLQHSLTQEIKVEVYDRPTLPDQLSLMLWRDWLDDDGDGIPNATEFVEFVLSSPTNLTKAQGNYTFYLDDTDAPNGGIVAGYVNGSDAAGNIITKGGGPGIDEQLFTYQLAQDGAPYIVGTGGFSDGEHSWLHPATEYEISIPFDEPNGLADLEDVRFQLASNSIVDSLEVVWNATTNRCVSSGDYLIVNSCHIHARDGEIRPYTSELELRLDFSLDWGLPIENDLRRAPAITVTDRSGSESWLELPQLRWRFSPNLAILSESIVLDSEVGAVINHSAWVLPGSGLNISGQVTFMETGFAPTLPFDVSILLDGERTIISTTNGYFLSQLNAPIESKSHALSFELTGLPPEAVDATDPADTLFWIEVDGNPPTPSGVDSPREGTEISVDSLSQIKVELLLSEQEKLDVGTLELYYKVSLSSQLNGPSLIEGSEPLIVSGSPVGQSISASSVVDIVSRLPEDSYQESLSFSVWVKGSDMAGNAMESTVLFNSGSNPFATWKIEQLVADIDITKVSYSRSGEIESGQTTMVTVELRNSGHAPGSVKLLGYEMGRDGENRSLTPVPVSVVVPMGERITYDIDWIPEDKGERWVIISLEDGSSIEGDHINILGDGSDDPLGSAFQDVPMTWIAVIVILLLILTLVVSLALRTGGSSESVLDDTDDWGDDWEEEETTSTYASPAQAMSTISSDNTPNYQQYGHNQLDGQVNQQYHQQPQQVQQTQYQWTPEQIKAYEQQNAQNYYSGYQQPPQ